jgi:hypothetical protein
MVVHFHDWRVPPEEEILAAKLILEHREPWLRNEATMLGGGKGHGPDLVFKNPFGNGWDGVPDSNATSNFGNFLRGTFELDEIKMSMPEGTSIFVDTAENFEGWDA